MMDISVATGQAAVVAGTKVFGDADFGYNYTGFRSFDRFADQLAGSKVGLITWPGGSLAENAPGVFGLEYEGLWNGGAAQADLPELMEAAHAQGAGLSVVLPTLRYMHRGDALRTDIRDFMADLLGGHYGPLPERMILEIGSEYYATFAGIPGGTAEYAQVANQMVEEIQAALADPSVNLLGADVDIAVQAGRTFAEDEIIRDGMSETSLRAVDMVIHHRFSFTAEGVDVSADEMGRVLDAWEADATAAGGERPDLFLGTYNVASYTRGEALRDYIASMKGQGQDISAQDIDLDARSHTGFESYWQDRMERYDYGAEHPRVLLEMLAEYGGEGMGAAGTYGSDMIHPGRFTSVDAAGNPVKFVGQDMLDMMAESIGGTRLLQVSLSNDGNDDVWVYGFESEDKLVLFLSADDIPPGQVTLDLSEFGNFRAVWGDSLTARTPDDWMARFAIADNPAIDESPEGRSYALGVREGILPHVGRDGVTVSLDQPDEVIRLAFAKTPTGAEEIAGWAGGPMVELGPQVNRTDDMPHDGIGDDIPLHLLPQRPDFDDRMDDQSDETDDDDDLPGSLADLGLSGALAVIPALLMMLV